ncbi:hypothetical protein QYE76_043079 [Lolium multiflorum]|uniref:Retrotransposon gag domain-containing protein n=1 Tax=Lolium multiflorum TaxID=4521 RepID=A0AAD8WXL6_LOLMU|nr:hypothetical protein QYE76_043079 [Lolium multiflorum]
MNVVAITMLVDWWRPETHTFHLRAGEMTPTLQDVSMIIGLSIQGEPLCMNTASDGWREQMEGPIGMAPPEPPNKKDRSPAGANYKWIKKNFGRCPVGANEDTFRTYTRVYLWYEEGASIARGGEEQLDVKMDVKLDTDLDMKIFHGRAREEREACTREEEEVQAGPASGQTGRHAGAPGHWPYPTGRHAGSTPEPTGRHADGNRVMYCSANPAPGLRLAPSPKKDPASPVTWREYEALHDHLQREIRGATEAFDTDIQSVNLKIDEATTAINTVQTSMTTLQASIHNLTQAVDEIRTMVQQPQQPLDEDGSINGDNAEAAAAQGVGRGIGRGPRGVNRGFAEIGACRVPPQPQDDGLGKPKFSIPRFEGTTDVEEYLTWELKIERLWHLHDYTEDMKIKLASSEFDGYALRWWDGLVRAREEDGELPIITWRTMKTAMRARFVPTNYLRSVFEKLTQLKQGVMTVDAYYMEMEMLM